MRVLFVFRALHSKTRPPSQPFISRISRAFSNLQLPNGRPSFGIAFDIDGVILRGREPVGGSQFALTRLYDDCGDLKIPFLFLTNGGFTFISNNCIDFLKADCGAFSQIPSAFRKMYF
ncbi:hypothetical protein MRB53_024793 [Persea americana]|uniref:Uncharacterized protein n=1 Tax=Persea americana TaxID=3435 RepID=A0ACC2LDE3_PERAE|nr:hypothetical protein MRB53_024793 [Persea americana]